MFVKEFDKHLGIVWVERDTETKFCHTSLQSSLKCFLVFDETKKAHLKSTLCSLPGVSFLFLNVCLVKKRQILFSPNPPGSGEKVNP